MAEDGVRTESEYGGHPAGLDRDRPMTHRVNASMESAQPAAPESNLDHLRRHAELQELPPRHRPMLSAGECRDRPVEIVRRQSPLVVSRKVRRMFWVSSTPNVRRVFHPAHGAEGMRACGARFVPAQSRGAP
jgi:hypothetical protein